MTRKITGFLLALFIAGMALGNLLDPDRIFSEHENRYLQEMPLFTLQRLFSGCFGSDFDLYVQDQFPDRDAWIAIKTLSERLLGKKDNGRVYFGRQGYLLMIDPEPDQQLLAHNSATLRELLRQIAGQQPDLRAALLLIPSAAAALPELLPARAPSPDPYGIINPAAALIGDQAILVDSLSALQAAAARDSRQLYYRTDHHWTTAGAYAVYQAWAQAMGLVPLDRSAFVITPVSDQFFGTSWSQTHVWSCDPDTIESWQTPSQLDLAIRINGSDQADGMLYHPAFLAQKDKYAYFLGGNYATVDIRTGNQNGRTLLLVKDSYANAFIPFLTQHYERLLIIDPRHLHISLADTLLSLDGFVPTDFLLLCQLNQFAKDASYGKLVSLADPQS